MRRDGNIAEKSQRVNLMKFAAPATPPDNYSPDFWSRTMNDDLAFYEFDDCELFDDLTFDPNEEPTDAALDLIEATFTL